MGIVVQNGASNVKKSTAAIVSHVNIVMNVGRITAINVKDLMSVISWAVKINYVNIALKIRHATVATLLDVEIVFYLTFVIAGTATKLFALTVFGQGIAGVVSAMVVDLNFVPLNVDTTYRNAVKKMGKAFVLIVHLRVRVCIDGRYTICGMRFI